MTPFFFFFLRTVTKDVAFWVRKETMSFTKDMNRIAFKAAVMTLEVWRMFWGA